VFATQDNVGEPYTAILKVIDNEGAFDTDEVVITVLQVPPTAVLANNGPVSEHSTATVSFSNQADVSTADLAAGFTYSYDFDNDGTFEVIGTTEATAAVPASLLDDGPGARTVRGRILDKDGAFTDYLTSIEILNVAPTASLTNSGPVVEGSTATVTLANQADASRADTTTGFTYSFDFDQDGVFDVVNSLVATATVPASYLDDGPATRSVGARITDKDGGFTDYATTIEIFNAAPSLVIRGAASVQEGAVYTLGLSATDPGADTISSWSIDWGDGTVETVLGNPASVTHTYADGANSYTIRASATDEDGT